MDNKSYFTLDEKNLYKIKKSNSNEDYIDDNIIINNSKKSRLRNNFLEQSYRSLCQKYTFNFLKNIGGTFFSPKKENNNIIKIRKKNDYNSFSLIRKNTSLNNSKLYKKEMNNLKNKRLHSFRNSISNEIILYNNENNKINFEEVKNYLKDKLEEYKIKIEKFYLKNNKIFQNNLYEKFPDLIAKILKNEIKLYISKKEKDVFLENLEKILNINSIKKLFFEEIIDSIFYRNMLVNFQNEEIIKNDIKNIINKELFDLISIGKNLIKQNQNETQLIKFIFPLKAFLNDYKRILINKRKLNKTFFNDSNQFEIKIAKKFLKIQNKKEEKNLLNNNNIIFPLENHKVEIEDKRKKKELKRRKNEDELMKLFTEKINIKHKLKYTLSDENFTKKKKIFESNNKENKIFYYKIFHHPNEKKIIETLNIKSLSLESENRNNLNKKIFNDLKLISKFEKQKQLLLFQVNQYIKYIKSLGINYFEELKIFENFQNKIISIDNKNKFNFNSLKNEFNLLKIKVEKFKNRKKIKTSYQPKFNFLDYHYIFQKTFNLRKNNDDNKRLIITNYNHK